MYGGYAVPLPLQSTIFRDNSAKRIDITVGELLSKRVEIFPKIPSRANQFPGNSVAHLGCKVDAQSPGFLERHTTGIALLQRFLIEFFPNSVRTGAQNFLEQPRVEGSRSNRVHVDRKFTQFL